MRPESAEIKPRSRIAPDLPAIDALNAVNAQVAILDGNGTIVGVNQEWTRAMNWRGGDAATCASGANYLDVCARAGEAGDHVARRVHDGLRAVLDGASPSFSIDYNCGLVMEHWYEMTALPLHHAGYGALLTHINISRARRAESQVSRLVGELSHVDRVSVLGELAPGLAHEIRQPLAAIAANAQAGERLLETSAATLPEVREILGDIGALSMRANAIIERMRSFIRKRGPESGSMRIDALISDTLVLLRPHMVRSGVQVELELQSNLPPVVGDALQIQQVLMNLMNNAVEAMEATPRECRRLRMQARLERDCEIRVSVSDSGPGFADADPERLFDEFYTTKPDGVGLGLSIARSIVETHGGSMSAVGGKDRGATFTFTLAV